MTLYEFLKEHKFAKIEVSEYGRPLAMFNNEKIRQYEETIREYAIDECITKLLTESVTCFSDVIAILEQLKEQKNE